MNINTTVSFAFAVQSVADTAVSLVGFGTGLETFTQAQLDNANRIRITISSGAMRFRYDGGDPTTAAGHLLASNTDFFLDGNANIKALRIIRSGAANATVAVTLEE